METSYFALLHSLALVSFCTFANFLLFGIASMACRKNRDGWMTCGLGGGLDGLDGGSFMTVMMYR